MCEVRTKPPFFLIHRLYVQGNCTRWTVPFFLCSCQRYRMENLHTRRKVALKLHESFQGALPYLASKSSPLFPLQGITWKQTTTDCAIACSSSLFLSSSKYPHFPLFDRSMALPKSLICNKAPCEFQCVCTGGILQSQTTDLLSVFIKSDIFTSGEITEKVQWKKMMYFHLRTPLLASQLVSCLCFHN